MTSAPSPRSVAGLLLSALAIFGAGVIFGTILQRSFHTHKGTSMREFNNKYHFINPLLACADELFHLSNEEVKDLEAEMRQTIATHKNVGDITEASVYYRDLQGGPWVGVDFDAPFSPGSLLKVPLAMSVFKVAESDPTILDKKLHYVGGGANDEQFFKPDTVPEGDYTVTDLLSIMLLSSDNDAANLLANSVGADNFLATYDHLGITKPPVEGAVYTTSTHEYASFFRILYNATYLDGDHSEKLLSLLSQSKFRDALVAGVPGNVVVAHKFGERSFDNSNLKQLHDCGIVYAPGHPYMICIMTKGYDYKLMAGVIAELSKLAYDRGK